MSENNQPINQYFIDQSEQISISDLLFGIWDYKYFTIIIIILLNVFAYLFYYSQPKVYENSIKLEMSNKINFDLLPGFVEKIEGLGMSTTELLEQFSSETLSKEVINKTYQENNVKEILETYNINNENFISSFSIEKFYVKTIEDISNGRPLDIYEYVLTIDSEVTSQQAKIIFDKHLVNSLRSTNNKFTSWLIDYDNYLDNEMLYTKEKYKNLNDAHADALTKKLIRLRKEQELNALMEIDSLKNDYDIAKTLGIEIPIVDPKYLKDAEEEAFLFSEQMSDEDEKKEMTDFMEDQYYYEEDMISKFFFGTVVLEKIIKSKESKLRTDSGPTSKQEAALLARIANEDYAYDMERDLELSELITKKRNVMSVYEEFNKSKIFIPFVKFDTDQISTNGVKIPSLYIFLSTLAFALILTFILSIVWPEYKRRYYNQ